jgi:hypothetical protein
MYVVQRECGNGNFNAPHRRICYASEEAQSMIPRRLGARRLRGVRRQGRTWAGPAR